MSGVVRGILLGAGGALGICSQTESLNDVPRMILKGALNGYDKVSGTSIDLSSIDQTDDVKALAEEIKNLRLITSEKSQDKQIIVYGSGSGTSTLVKVVIIGTAGVCVCYYFGFGFNDIMYVTKSTLNKAVSHLEEKVGFIGIKLEKTKEQLLSLIASVEESVFSTSAELKQQIDTETSKINGKIDDLDFKFERIEVSQSEIGQNTRSLGAQVTALQEKFEVNGVELQKANSGIRLLVNSVVNLPHVREDQGLYADLKEFLSSNLNWFRSTEDKADVPEEENAAKKSKTSGLFGMIN